MYYWQPGKWVQYAGFVVVPFIGASFLTTNGLQTDVSKAALTAAGGDWAKINLDGRDATITGIAPTESAKDAAVKAVGSVPGIRLVDNVDGIKVAMAKAPEPAKVEPAKVEPPKAEPLAAPTVTAARADANGALITGTWPEGKAKTLDVIVNNNDYSLGKSPELTSSAGNWALKLGAGALAAGSYAISAKVGDGDQQSVAAAADQIAPLVIPAAEPPKPEPLAAPTVTEAKSDATGTTITGTWPEGKAKTLDVIVNDIDYSLGKSSELTSSAGNWVLKLAAGVLPAGAYSIAAKVGDGASQSISAAADKMPQLTVAAPEAPKPTPLAAPTVTSAKGDDKGTVITGTWAEGIAKSLDVGVDNKVYTLGEAKELTSDKGVWTLTLPPLPPGPHNAGAINSDGSQNVATGKSFEIAAAAPPPPPPPAKAPAAATAQSVTATVDKPTVTGTWPVGSGNTYQVELDGVTHTLGKDTDLLTGTDGKWTLKPAKPLVNGTYDVIMKVTGADGQVTSSVSKGAVVINVPPPAPPPPKEAPYDCAGALSKTAATNPIRFEFDHADLGEDYVKSLSSYASVLNDERCKAIHVQIVGHADSIGSDDYNKALSERRAATVSGLLGKAGIDATRLSSEGVGSSKPLDPDNSADARAKNRRAELSVK